MWAKMCTLYMAKYVLNWACSKMKCTFKIYVPELQNVDQVCFFASPCWRSTVFMRHVSMTQFQDQEDTQIHNSTESSGRVSVRASLRVTHALSSPLMSQALSASQMQVMFLPAPLHREAWHPTLSKQIHHALSPAQNLRDAHWPVLTGTGWVALSKEPLRPTEPHSWVRSCVFSLGHIPVRALLGKNE